MYSTESSERIKQYQNIYDDRVLKVYVNPQLTTGCNDIYLIIINHKLINKCLEHTLN